jgi:hypothetical protein
MRTTKEAQFQNQVEIVQVVDILDEEDVSLGLQLTLRDAAKEYQMLEEQVEYLSSFEDSVHSLQKELNLLKAEIKGHENELSYLDSQKEIERYYLDGAIILNRNKKEELERNIEELDGKKALVKHILDELDQKYQTTQDKLKIAEKDLRKLLHVKMRIKHLFHRVFRHPNSSFCTESELFQECQLLKAQLQVENRLLKKVNDAREQVMAIVKSFSQSFQESSYIESERDRHAAFTLLVCKTRTEYSKVKKCHSCIPKLIPPCTAEPHLDPSMPMLDGISPSDQYSQEELQKSIDDQQMILNDITAVINKIKRNSNSIELELNHKRHMLETERKRIFHSLIFSWERQRVFHDSASKDVDLPPPYEAVPAYELDSDEELDNCPLQYLKRHSVIDLGNLDTSLNEHVAESEALENSTRSRKKPCVPLIELIDKIRSNSVDLPPSV